MTSVAVVLGVGPGLGAALARKLAHEGYQVAMLARNSDYLSKLSDEITKTGGRVCLPYLCAHDLTGALKLIRQRDFRVMLHPKIALEMLFNPFSRGFRSCR